MRPSGARFAALLIAATAPTLLSAGPATAVESVHFVERTIGTDGPLGSVTFIGDSVGIGAGRFHPSLDDHLLALGWGPVRFHAVDGKRTGYPPGWPDYFNAVPMIDEWQAAGWDSDAWIINLGANDSGYCGSDVACARASIMLVVDAIGPGHTIWWPKITRFYTLQHQADAWNVALDQIAAERDDFHTWDWPAEMGAHPDVYGSWDNTHLYPDGYRHRSAVMAHAFTAAVTTGRRVGGDETLPDPSGRPLGVVALEPRRAIDTRTEGGVRLAPGVPRQIALDRLIPASAQAVAVNVAMVDPSGPGFVTASACGATPGDTATVNSVGRTRAAGAIVALGDERTVCVTASVATDVIVDVQAAFVPASSAAALRLAPLVAPTRLVDTRHTGRAEVLALATPAGAEMVAVNITVTGADEPAFVTAYPCADEVPLVSNVNVLPGDTNAGAAFVTVGEGGAICVRSSASADVIVDLTATLDSDADLVYVPVAPTRMLDTRDATGGWAPMHGAGQMLDVGVAPQDARAVSATLAIVQPLGPSFLTAAPCGADTTTSSINAAAGDVVANGLTVGVTAGRLCVTSRTAAHTVVDVNGWWVPG